MSKRLKLILTRPADDSFEEFVRFRENSKIRFANSEPVVIKEELINEWEKFWERINLKPNKKFTIGYLSEYLN